MKELFDLMTTFARIGALTFGGGYAMLPFLQREIVEKRAWATMEEISDYFAIGQCTPGIIAVNTATFIGFKRKGAAGGIAATVGLVIPSLVIISAVALGLENFAHLPAVRHAFAGIRIAVGALILEAVVKLFKGTVKNPSSIIICVAAFVASLLFKASPILVAVAAGTAGFLLYAPKRRDER